MRRPASDPDWRREEPSGVVEAMDVTQAKQEHLLALKGTSFSTPCIKLFPSPGAYRDFHLV